MPKFELKSSGVSHCPGWMVLLTILPLRSSRNPMAFGVVPAGYRISTNNFSGSLITSPARIFSFATRTGTESGTACLALIRAVR